MCRVHEYVDEAYGKQYLAFLTLVELTQKAHLQDETDESAGHSARQCPDPEVAVLGHPDAYVAAEHVEGAVGHVDDAHQAHGQRQTGRHQEEHQAVREPYRKDA